MARMHSKKRGRSGSRKSKFKTLPAWVRQSKDDVFALVEKYAKEGASGAAIGQKLRDEHGVPSVKLVTGKTISQILAEKNLAGKYPADMLDLIRRAVAMRRHLKENSRDSFNKQKLVHVESKIKRLVRYYRGKKLPSDWAYDPETAALLVK